MTQEDENPFPPKRSLDHPLDPPQSLIHLTEKPIERIRHWDGSDPWLITRYADVQAVLNSPKFSADPRSPGYPEKTPSFGAMMSGDRNLRTMDGAEHRTQKQMILRDFLPARVHEMVAGIRQLVNQLIDKMVADGPPADIVTAFAEPIPVAVICQLFGVPIEDNGIFKNAANLVMSTTSAPSAANEVGDELFKYIETLIEQKLANPQNDLISRLAVEQLSVGKMSRKDVVEMCRLLLIAGHDTTANMIAASVLALLLNPEQRAYFAQDLPNPERSRALDELFRYVNVTHSGRRRVAIADVEVGGQLIAAGDGVICMTNIADRDEAMFANANQLDLTRRNAHLLMGFGTGPHKCIGAYLSKVEIDIALTTLFTRLPTLDLECAPADLKLREDMIFGLQELRVKW